MYKTIFVERPVVGRPKATFLGLSNETVQVLAAYGAPAGTTGPDAFQETEDESTTHNRRVEYLCRCMTCNLHFRINKKALSRSRRCGNCQRILDFQYKPASLQPQSFTMAPPTTLFVTKDAFSLVTGNLEQALVKLTEVNATFAKAWQAGNRLSFTFPSYLLSGKPEPFSLADSAAFIADLQAQAKKDAEVGKKSRREEDLEDPDNLIHQEGWHSDLAGLAETFGFLQPLPNKLDGWLVREDTRDLLLSARLSEPKLAGVSFKHTSQARYAEPDAHGYIYAYPDEVIPTESYFG